MRLANVMLVGETLTGVMPLPESATDWGLLTALSAKVSDDVRFPSADGVNVTETLQVSPASSVAGAIGQLLPEE